MTTGEHAEIDEVVAGQTVASEFVKLVAAHPDAVALRWRDEAGDWQQFTYGEYAAGVARYADAYRAELDHFIACVETGAAPLAGFAEGREALRLADAALESMASGRTVRRG